MPGNYSICQIFISSLFISARGARWVALVGAKGNNQRRPLNQSRAIKQSCYIGVIASACDRHKPSDVNPYSSPILNFASTRPARDHLIGSNSQCACFDFLPSRLMKTLCDSKCAPADTRSCLHKPYITVILFSNHRPHWPGFCVSPIPIVSGHW